MSNLLARVSLKIRKDYDKKTESSSRNVALFSTSSAENVVFFCIS
jgi:hypothetical protein